MTNETDRALLNLAIALSDDILAMSDADILADAEDDPDAAPKLLAEWIGYAWDGLREGRIGDKGYPQWCFNGIGHKQFQGGKQDLRDLVERIVLTEAKALHVDLRGDGETEVGS